MVLVGAPGEGTSSLVDAVVGAPVCPVGDDGGTTVPWVVRGGPVVCAELVETPAGDGEPLRRQLPVRGLPAAVADHAAPGRVSVEVQLPRRVLDTLELVDTPGVGGPGDPEGSRARAAVSGADVVWLVLDAGAPLLPEVADVVRAAVDADVPVHPVLSRTDLHPAWSDRVRGLRAELARLGVDGPVRGVCARLADEAVRRAEPGLLVESGVPDLVAAVPPALSAVPGGAAGPTRAALVAAAAALRAHGAARLAELQDPAAVAVAALGLDDVRDRVDRLRRQASRWQQVLGDGTTDLVADLEHDLRDRLRAVTRDADEALDAHDPGAMWPAVDGWLHARVAEAVTVNARWAADRVDWLTGEVLALVEADLRDVAGTEVGAAPGARVGDARGLLAGLADVAVVDRGRLTALQKVLVGMRGSYSGILMIGLVTSLAGLPLVNPVSVGAGLLIGGKAYRDDAAQRLTRRRGEAKGVVRRHLDEVGFQVGKHLRDELRGVQRTLRDVVAGHVDALQRAATLELRTAQEANRRQTADRDREVRALRRRLEQVATLERAVAALPAGGGPTGVVQGVA
ncbi:GTPase [Modestobacter sp. Leaf380]|uniref:GTPase n=1 Tax=Modestobacter sp. Leaf380 TaxID=1736356 RepID=UPI0006FFE133|nr:GTPase [Modestobacter sp. Leaf380]KQS71497.1 hypothetical protein ASG41_19660 [Modestobacter sp. Leaf380]